MVIRSLFPDIEIPEVPFTDSSSRLLSSLDVGTSRPVIAQ
jgi:hypothetical protein